MMDSTITILSTSVKTRELKLVICVTIPDSSRATAKVQL